MRYVAVDIGATNFRIAVGEYEEQDFKYLEKKPSRPLYVETGEEFTDVLGDKIEEAVEEAGISTEDIDAIGVAGPGPVDIEKGTFNPFFFEPDEVDLSPLKEMGDVYMHNDVKVASLGEYTYGVHETEDMVYVTISSGIGGGAVLNDTLVEGSKGNAGEVGHLTVDYDSNVTCGCGGVGHWHAVCGGKGLPEMAKKEFGHSFDDAEKLFERFQAGGQKAAEVVEKFQEYNLRALEEIVNMYNPDKVVFGGAVALNNEEAVLGDLRKRLDSVNSTPEIELSGIGDDVGLYGAKAMCVEGFERFRL